MLKHALELNPLYANTHYVLGKLNLKKGNLEVAKSYFGKACGFDPDHVGAYHQLCLIARRHGDKAKAAELDRIVQGLNQKADKNYQGDLMVRLKKAFVVDKS